MSDPGVGRPGSAGRSLLHAGPVPARARGARPHPGRDPHHHRGGAHHGQKSHDMPITSQALTVLDNLCDINNCAVAAPASVDLRNKRFVWSQRTREIVTQSNGNQLDWQYGF